MTESKTSYKYLFASLPPLAVVLLIANIVIGSVYIPVADTLSVLTGGTAHNDVWQTIILKSRLPQTITAIAAGGALAVGGLMMQTLFRNPLADPSILGISSGAGLGVAIIIMLFGGAISFLGAFSYMAIIFAAFTGAIAVLLLIILLAQRIKNNAMLLIVGIMIGYLSSAVVGILNLYGSQENVHSYVIWGLGSFGSVTWQQMPVFLSVLLIGVSIALALIKPLNMLLLGEVYAQNLGLNIRRTRLLLMISTGLITAAITAFCGPIAFLGLAVPHITRLLFRSSNHAILVPATMLTGICIALLCNLISRLPGVEGALPINAVTSVIGAPIVIWVILSKRYGTNA